MPRLCSPRVLKVSYHDLCVHRAQLFFASWMLVFCTDSVSDILDGLLFTVFAAIFLYFIATNTVAMHLDYYGKDSRVAWLEDGFPLWMRTAKWMHTTKALAAAEGSYAIVSPVEDEKTQPLMSAVDHRLDNPLSLVQAHPDLATAGSAAAEKLKRLSTDDLSRPGMCEFHGMLRKRNINKGLSLLDLNQWRDRYFVLSEGTLLYWRSEEDFQAFMDGDHPTEGRGSERLSSLHADDVSVTSHSRRSSSLASISRSLERRHPLEPERIDLALYKVVVDMYDFTWGFFLERRDVSTPTGVASTSDERGSGDARHQRCWHLRAPSEALRLAWADKLIRASRWAAEQQALANSSTALVATAPSTMSVSVPPH